MSITLRKVKKNDWSFILQLRNEQAYKNNFYNRHHITQNEHFDYLAKQKSNPNFFNWIICFGKKNVGYLRVLDGDVSIIVDKNYHGKGIGSKALGLLEKEAKKLGLKKLVGRVMISNKESKKIFEKNGYKLLMYWLEKDIS